ncbi:MAG: hypothetical protein R6U95_04790 [Bacteroidales bacterium]
MFFEQLDEVFSNSSKSRELRKFHRQLENYWEESVSDEEHKKIVATSNVLLKKYARAFPHFLHYFTAIQLFFDTDHSMPSYYEWDLALQYVAKNVGMNATDRFLQNTIILLEENKLHESSTTTWRAARLRMFEYSYNEENHEVKITFPPTDLVCESAGNEFVLYQASGYYLPFENKWIGTGGKVSWERAGFNSEVVYADLSNYEIDMKTNRYKADSVWFTNKNYFDEPVQGKLQEKTVNVRNPQDVSYPRFQSYQQVFNIDDIYPGINFKGGVTMYGARVIGSGNKDVPSTLIFERGDSTIVYCRAPNFIFNPEDIIGQNTEVTIYIGNDSIYHPGLLFQYDVPSSDLTLIRNEDSDNLSKALYINSYHMISMDFPQLTWNINELSMKMGGMEGSSVNQASFESVNYFRNSLFNELGMYDQVHPLVALVRLEKQEESNTFHLNDFANYLGFRPVDVEQLCLNLFYKGLIDYDIEDKVIEIMPKTERYIRARMGYIDYDVIRFDSEHDVRGLHSALLDLTTFELEMTGVSEIQVSDSQNVIFQPRGSQLTMTKNRDFTFDGVIEAGLFTFYGRGFDFNYDEFRVGLKNVDSLKIKVESFTPNEYGIKPLVNVQNAIQNVTGEIFIDDPDNKSSIKDFPDYPIFDSKKPSFVYYDYPAIYKSVYRQDDFYFEVDPYVIDSINSFSTDDLFFEGEFKSAGIFETMREKIVVRSDYSFGFQRTTGDDGYPVYKGKGTFTDTIDLSFSGLQGIGRIDYLNTYAESSQGITFFPDSAKGLADSYHIAKQTKDQGAEYPEVNGEEVNILWVPYENKWESESTGKSFKMYGDTTELVGGLSFSPTGLGGWGRYSFSEAILNSDDYTFKEYEVLAEKSSFDLAAEGKLKDMAFETENVQSYVNFETKKANFKANDEKTVVTFPQNKYICYLNQFTWDMITKQIELGNPRAIDQEGVDADLHFYSRLMSQDTINFQSPYAKYDLNNHIIDAYQVPHIDVADSRIFPHKDSIIRIRRDADMRTIKNATFVANRENEYHTIYDATFNVEGKLEFTGSGYYDYIDKTKQKQTVLFSHIGVDSATRTYATGRIAEEDEFTLSPNYKYYGELQMNAWEKYLTFNGTALIANECDEVDSQWFNFESKINPDTIYIPVAEHPVSRNGDTLGISVYINNRPTHFYTAFLSPMKTMYDARVVNASGFLFYDDQESRYKIASKEKIENSDVQGNLLSFHKSYCTTRGEGELNFAADLGQIDMEAYGTINHNIRSNRVTVESFLTVDFMFDRKTMRAIADTLLNNPTVEQSEVNSSTFKRGIVEMLGDEAAEEIQSEIQLYGKIRKSPSELERSIVFSDVDFVWDSVASAYRSVGQLEIYSILGEVINKKVDGYVEVAKLYAGDMLTIYIKISDEKWYFFHYNRENMEFVSSDKEMNLDIEALKERDRVMDVSRKEVQYKYHLSSIAVKNNFVGKFEAGEGYMNTAPPNIPDPGTAGQSKPKSENQQQNNTASPQEEDEEEEEDDGYDDYGDYDDYDDGGGDW